MNDARWDRLEALFSKALELPETERGAYLAEQCGDDQALLAEVLDLLATDNAGGSLTSAVGEVSGDLAAVIHDTHRLQPGDLVNDFEIVSILGTGGMGEVYEVIQHKPVKRSVALKIMLHSLRSPAALYRFEAECQSLALMEHPAIAKVFDAGQTTDGRSYFAMELIDGLTIDRYVTEHSPSINELLKLYVRVCRGVEHAHQKGIIHRDLKPSNILICAVDGDRVPKVIDFGIAKPFESEAGDDLTLQGQVLGTPRYMSPEQADSLGQKADTRSDVYALGTVLYELLCGEHPLDLAALQSNSQAERRAAFERETKAPPSQIAFRNGDRERSKELSGDLDAITLKALQHDPGQRYRSAAELADDLQRVLDDQPVLAIPPRLGDRLGKFYRRHRAAVLAGSVAGLALLVGIGAASVSYVRTVQAQQQAQQNAATAESVTEFLIGLFDASDPSNPDTTQMTVRELLDRGAERLHDGLASEPLTQLKSATTIGRVYLNLGMHAAALPLLDRAIALGDQHQIANADLVSALIAKGTAHRRLDQLEPAMAAGARAVRLSERLPDPNDALTGAAYSQLGTIQVSAAEFDKAEQNLNRAVKILKAVAPAEQDTATAIYNLAGLYFSTDRPEPALPLLEEAIAILTAIDDRLPELMDYYTGLGALHFTMGNMDQSQAALERALERKRVIMGNDHYTVALTLGNLAKLDMTVGRYSTAIERLEEAIEIQQQSKSPVRPSTWADFYGTLSAALRRTGALEKAEDAAMQSIELWQDGAPTDPGFKGGQAYLAAVRQDQGRFSEARALYAETLAHLESILGAEHLETIRLIERIGDMERAAGETVRAKALYAQALKSANLAGIADRPQIQKIAEAYAELEAAESVQGEVSPEGSEG